ncbi:hypothetical protein KR200_007996, partial [Drosophila serrata]
YRMRGLILASLVCLAVASAWAGTIGVSQGDPFEHEGRIVGGEDTTIAAHPYQVSLQTKSGSHFCGGSLLDEETVVTAAHCLVGRKASKVFVRLGSTLYNEGGIRVAVRNLTYNENYSSQTMENDVGILKLAEKVQETEDIRYVELAKETPQTGTTAVVTGWGAKCYFWCMSLPKVLQEVYVSILQQVKVPIVDSAKCQEAYNWRPITEAMICAGVPEGGKDACQGDSGGPLVVNGKLTGIVSWGEGCARPNYPGVYSNVAHFKDWIAKQTG